MPCCLGQPKSKAIWPNFRRPTFTLLISLYCRTVLNLLDELRIGTIHTKKNWVDWPSQLHKSVYFVVLDWHLQPSRLMGRGYQCSHQMHTDMPAEKPPSEAQELDGCRLPRTAASRECSSRASAPNGVQLRRKLIGPFGPQVACRPFRTPVACCHTFHSSRAESLLMRGLVHGVTSARSAKLYCQHFKERTALGFEEAPLSERIEP